MIIAGCFKLLENHLEVLIFFFENLTLAHNASGPIGAGTTLRTGLVLFR
jgi:hypothetical protein